MNTPARLDPDLDDETAKVIIAFCIHEHLRFPETKKMFLEQPEKIQKEHLKMFKDVTGNPLFDNNIYHDFLAIEAEKQQIVKK